MAQATRRLAVIVAGFAEDEAADSDGGVVGKGDGNFVFGCGQDFAIAVVHDDAPGVMAGAQLAVALPGKASAIPVCGQLALQNGRGNGFILHGLENVQLRRSAARPGPFDETGHGENRSQPVMQREVIDMLRDAEVRRNDRLKGGFLYQFRELLPGYLAAYD